jgi:ribosomal protein S27E
MSGRFEPPEEFDDWEAEDPEGPQGRDLDRDEEDETPTVPCPGCGEQIPDFADRCPYCGDWVVQSAGRRARPPLWLIVTVLVLIAGFLMIYVFR